MAAFYSVGGAPTPVTSSTYQTVYHVLYPSSDVLTSSNYVLKKVSYVARAGDDGKSLRIRIVTSNGKTFAESNTFSTGYEKASFASVDTSVLTASGAFPRYLKVNCLYEGDLAAGASIGSVFFEFGTA